MLHGVRLGRKVMFHAVKSNSPAPFGTGMTLAEEEHEQEQNGLQLPVAQLKLYCQCYHSMSPDYAGSAANWLMVGFGGYEEPRAVWRLDSWPPYDGIAIPPGIALSGGEVTHPGQGSQFLKHNVRANRRAPVLRASALSAWLDLSPRPCAIHRLFESESRCPGL